MFALEIRISKLNRNKNKFMRKDRICCPTYLKIINIKSTVSNKNRVTTNSYPEKHIYFFTNLY